MIGGWSCALRELVAGSSRAVERRARHDSKFLAMLDQEGARLRDELDELGVNVADPEQLRIGLAFMVVFQGRIDGCSKLARSAMAPRVSRAARNGIVAALLPLLPQEARRAAP